MSSFFYPRAFVPLSVDTTTPRTPGLTLQQQPSRVRLARNAIGGLNQLLRDPTTTLFKLLDGSPLGTSSVATDNLGDAENIKSLLRLRLLDARKRAAILVDFQH